MYHTLYCYNGTNFFGGYPELKECLQSFLSQEGHQHKESGRKQGRSNLCSYHLAHLILAVKSKHHLFYVVGFATFTYEELVTVVTEIESILNSRPLMQMSSNPNDFSAITPLHFLIGGP